ncbi:uncharacterized protein LOC116040500 isoform X2 [Sander lucioperca]|uniref:uncharacterized protein LOC116040500 isoform X2 n=1 Tax=Sander lucioperca TaxID=283035 RepID=UPI00125D1A6B|nr:uncharacterized protein LOC116040500 isoform X2 [Sander lucioperca]
MQVVSGGQSLWMYTLLFTSLQLWGRLSASTSSPPLPAPKLDIYSRSKSAVVLVCQAPEGHRGVNFMLYRTREKVDSQELQSGAEEVQFTVRVNEGNSVQLFCCLYKDQDGHYSVFSPYLQLEHTGDALPVPTLVVQQQTDVWHLLCTGSAAYPGAVFSLYLADIELPIATHRATLLDHQATFPVPVQDAPVAFYQCQYDVLLGRKWSSSERSLSLAVTRGIPPPSTTDLSGVDWPLVLGSFSAVVLFICSVALVVVVAHRKVKAAAEEKKKRQEAQFWTQVHAKDHVVDLTLRRTRFPSQEWASVDTTTETGSRSPLWNSLSTFTTPIPPIH